MKRRKMRGIESLKSRYGLLFISPWILGIALFFLTPVAQSVWYSLADVVLTGEGITVSFKGFGNYQYVLNENPDFSAVLQEAVWKIFYSLPIIVIVSLILALILNQKFHGRLFFRGLFFLPVIVATGIVLDLIFQTNSSTMSDNVSQSLSSSLFTVNDVMAWLDLPQNVAVYAQTIISGVFDLIWSSGIQIVLFISGLQSIPSSLYEACTVEGATAWERFWFVTFPMLARVTMLVIVFTMIDLFTDMRNPMIDYVYKLMQGGNYSETSAMMWVYFAIVGGVVAVLLAIYNRTLLRKWE